MYYQNEPKFKIVCLASKLSKTMKDGGFSLNLNLYKSMGTHRISLYVNDNSAKHYDSLEV